ncbi:MAG: bifunctional DNA primase/polymerase [Deltaproteobacteria bacterium]|nr:bifunctional DNA primase/polymerase [Deltaproteobacteria bacterium]TLN01414.1 MAG: bifunctional DNA primase/polymerase [bacterium]
MVSSRNAGRSASGVWRGSCRRLWNGQRLNSRLNDKEPHRGQPERLKGENSLTSESYHSDESKTILEAALSYLQRGFSVIPLEPRGKRPVVSWTLYQTRQATEEEVREWFDNDKGYNIGIVTGAISGLTVVDFDTQEAIQLAKERNFPVTPLAKTGKGYHAYCQYKEGTRNFQKRADLPGIDLRSDGGYVVAPPSVHSSGSVYQWVQGRGLDD